MEERAHVISSVLSIFRPLRFLTHNQFSKTTIVIKQDICRNDNKNSFPANDNVTCIKTKSLISKHNNICCDITYLKRIKKLEMINDKSKREGNIIFCLLLFFTCYSRDRNYC